jgi:BirA family biotin operon repressor/biotin-[acetyl-CoA-carboxylase] ligase
VYSETESTNDIAVALASQGAEEGSLVIADVQTKGRGRAGRGWHSPRSVGIWASLILRPKMHVSDTGYITLLMGVSIAQAIRRSTGLEAVLKWPNDVLVGDKKVCGILSETRSSQEGLSYVVSGFGINVHQTRVQFPEELRDQATSLYLASGRKYSRAALLRDILEQIEQRYELANMTEMIGEWQALSGRSRSPDRSDARFSDLSKMHPETCMVDSIEG